MKSGTAALYCRIPHRRDPEPVAVDEQETLGVDYARRRELLLPPRHIHIDHRRTAWRRDRDRPGWDGLLAALRAAHVDSVLLFRPENFELQPFDLAELFALADAAGIALHSFGYATDPAFDFWPKLRNRTVVACAVRTLLPRTASRERESEAAQGRPHGGGLRRYGYTVGMTGLMDDEAAVVAEIYDRFLSGDSLRAIAVMLNERGVPTATGKSWDVGGVARVLDAPRYAGLQVRGGEVVEGVPGSWPICVEVEVWRRVQVLRRESKLRRSGRSSRFYLLTGLLVCTACGGNMVGSAVDGYPIYACSGHRESSPVHRRRYISAGNLEALVVERALTILESWTDDEWQRVPIASSFTVPEATARLTAASPTVVVRSVAAMDGVATGPRAGFAWNRLTVEHRRAVLRYLFAVIRVGPSATPRSVFDAGRVDIVAAPLRPSPRRSAGS